MAKKAAPKAAEKAPEPKPAPAPEKSSKAKPATKAEVYSSISEKTGVAKKDVAAVFGALAKGGYAGWLVVEAEQDPAKAHPLTYARIGHDHTAALAARAFGA